MRHQCKLLLLLASMIVFCLLWMTLGVSPAQARDRVFLDLSLEFLGEYRLPQTEFLDTPVGGLSAITYDRKRDRLYALCQDNQLAPARFYTFKLTRTNTENPSFNLDIEAVTFLADNPVNPEGIALTPQQTLFISTATTPSVQEFDLNGKLQNSLPIPKRYLPDTNQGIQANLGFGSLTLNPVGTIPATGEPIRLFTATKSTLVQDQEAPTSTSLGKSRLLHYLIGFGPSVLIAEHVYPLDAPSSNLVELLAVDAGGHFLSLDRGNAMGAKIFQMTTGGATDTSSITSLNPLGGVRPVKKKLLLDLNELGIPLDNLQGMAFGPRLSDGNQSLLLVSNNNFTQPTQFLWFRLKQPR